MVIALIVLVGLGVIAALTVITVQGGTRSAATHRFQSMAVYAAESGGAAAMDYLRNRLDATTGYTALVSASNAAPLSPAGIAGNNKPPGDPGNTLSPDQLAWYTVVILNNRNDPGFVAGEDRDSRLTIVVTGYGPEGVMAILEWDLQADADGATPFALPASRAFTLVGWRRVL